MKPMFSWNSLAFSMIQWILAIWSLVPLPFVNPPCIAGSSGFMYCWSLVWRDLNITFSSVQFSDSVASNSLRPHESQHARPPCPYQLLEFTQTHVHWVSDNLTSMQNECNCMIVWTFSGIAFLWDWNENGHFPVLWPLLSFPNLLTYWVQHFSTFNLLGF